MTAPVALTGVPGTGKSTTAATLPSRLRSVELGDLAYRWGVARRSVGGFVVDLPGLIRRYRRGPPDVDVVVGHLAHLLPVRDVIVLRCHPEELLARLERCGRGNARDREDNYVAEALDLVLAEALWPRRRVWELDTSRRSAESVARRVARIVRDRPPARYGSVDWLADPTVTAHLLESTK